MDQLKALSSRLFEGMKFNDIDHIIKAANPVGRAFHKNEVIWRESSVVDGIGLLERGTLLRQYYQPNGKILLQGIFTPPDLIGVDAAVSRLRTSPAFVIAATNGKFTWFEYSSLFENPEIPDRLVIALQTNLLAYLADDCIRSMHKSDILSRRTIRDRVLIYLSILREKQGNEIDIAMSQDMIAQYLCVDRTSLSAELNRMRRDGLIDFKRKRYTLKYPDIGHP